MPKGIVWPVEDPEMFDGIGFYWDDAEDHGGFDRCTPCGPFLEREQAEADCKKMMGAEVEIEFGEPPGYYTDFLIDYHGNKDQKWPWRCTPQEAQDIVFAIWKEMYWDTNDEINPEQEVNGGDLVDLAVQMFHEKGMIPDRAFQINEVNKRALEMGGGLYVEGFGWHEGTTAYHAYFPENLISMCNRGDRGRGTTLEVDPVGYKCGHCVKKVEEFRRKRDEKSSGQ